MGTNHGGVNFGRRLPPIGGQYSTPINTQRPSLAQIEVNRVEAQHRSVFVAGWRPFIGWICGVALAWNFILRDFLVWGFTVWAPEIPVPAALQLEHLLTVLLSLLGLGGLRTFEKMSGRTK